MKTKCQVRWNKVPEGSRRLADRRTSNLVRFWGGNVQSLSIQDLVSSAYLQGISDMFDFTEKRQPSISDFQI